MESIFSRHLLKVIGILFLGASLWFAANSADSLFRIYESLRSPSGIISPLDGPSRTLSQDPEDSFMKEITFREMLWLIAAFAGWLGLQLLTRWRKRIEFQVISVFLVFLTLLVLIREFGWHENFVFPFLILVAAGIWFFGRHMSHIGTRINFFFTWGLFLFWWLLKIMINGDTSFLPGFFIFASLFFLSFHTILLLNGFKGRRALNNFIELVAIGLNVLFFYVSVALTILKFYGNIQLFLFTLTLSILYAGSLLLMEFLNRPFRKAPFLVAGMILLSLLLPLLFRQNQFILMTGSLALLLMFYSKQTKDQPSIIISLVLFTLMVLAYSKDQLFDYIPFLFLDGSPDETSMFLKGLISGIFVSLAAYTERKLLKGLEVQYSRKWFSRKRYLKLLKGIFLGGLYLVLLWIWQYLWLTVFRQGDLLYLSWFAYHCLFFAIAIPWLAYQRSSYLRGALLFSAMLTLLYPTLISIQNLRLLDQHLLGMGQGINFFPVHFIPAILFLCLLAILYRYAIRSYRKSIPGKRIVLVYIIIMVIFVSVSEMILIIVSSAADTSAHASMIMANLFRLPASMIVAAIGLILLIWGFVKQRIFSRTLALLLLFLVALKMALYDFENINLLTRVLLLFITGSVFIGLSLVYKRIQRTVRKDRHRTKLKHHN